jgi:hypothetical protein
MIYGTWEGKPDVDKAGLEKDGPFSDPMSEDFKKYYEALKKRMGASKIAMTFNKDGTCAMEIDGPGIPDEQKKEAATWEVVSSQGRRIEIKITTPESKQVDGSEKKSPIPPLIATLTFTDKSNMTFQHKNGSTLARVTKRQAKGK